MDKEEFKKRRSAIKAKSDSIWKDIEEHCKEEERVISVLHNAESILKRLDKLSKKEHLCQKLMFLY